MAKTKLSKLWMNFLGVIAMYFCYSAFHSSTILVGLTNDATNHSYTMTRKPSSWKVFWGMRSLELWKYFSGNEDLAISLLKGKTLIGLKKADVQEKMGLPAGGNTSSNCWVYFLQWSHFEYGSQLDVNFDEKDVVTSTSIFISS